MGRLRFATLSVIALCAACPAVFAADPAPVAAAIETGSLGGKDAEIGAAARRLIEPVAAAAHLLPADALPVDGAAAVAPPKPTPEELDRTALSTFYQARGDAPLWVTGEGFTAKARLALAELQRAGDWGLDPADFKVADIKGAPTPEALAEAESGLSLAVMAYARHARGGKIAKPAEQLSSYFDRRPQWMDRGALLSALAAADDPAPVLADLHPKHPQFNLLRQAWLETLRAKTAKGVKMPAGAELKPGDSHADIGVLRKRLGVTVAEGASPEVFDERLADAVRGFQTLKGITADGVLTAETRSKLNQPIKGNTDQLAANMQMWRYIPADLGDMHVMLNVPEYEIRIFKAGDEVFHERVTVGLINKQTPIFSDSMELVTFKSRWRVPDSIKVREIWPSLLSGGGMMRQHGLEMRRESTDELVDWRKIDWSKTPMDDYVIWQPPGKINQLGIVKFSFPNKHYVFMHDTPDKHMFAWTRRANSHGCMRIRNPLKMAEVILAADKGWDRAKIDDLVKTGPDHNLVPLDKKIPVHIVYFTARVLEGGKIETFGDIYGHENRFALALKGQWNKIKVGPDHLEPVDEKTPPRIAQRKAPKAKSDDSVAGLINSVLGGGF
ncbi:MAG: L,D-transpeptidase [Hyphomicrobium sp.]|nr:L,D-transpeptidase [Hyphomicrobium sp.]PPD08880.1 MAG: L,D-transpeptidase [Hyphomicrobium sp.]